MLRVGYFFMSTSLSSLIKKQTNKMNTIGETYVSSEGFIFIILGSLIAVVLIPWISCILIAIIHKKKQQELLARASCTMTIVIDIYNLVKELKNRSDRGEWYDLRSKFIAAASEIDAVLRFGLFKNSDGNFVSMYPLRHEINKKPIDCASAVSLRIIKETGLSDLSDEEVLDWLLAVARNFMLIKLESVSSVQSGHKIEDPALNDQYTALFNHCFSRLKTLYDRRPVWLEKTREPEDAIVVQAQVA